jgi:protein TonB
VKFIPSICLTFFCGLAAAQNTNVSNKVYTKVDVEAEFKGGASAWARFLNKNLSVPAECTEETMLEYPHVITFIVRKNGITDSVKLDRPRDNCWYNEITRIIKSSDKMWTPAFVNGKLVDSYKKVMIGCIMLETE